MVIGFENVGFAIGCLVALCALIVSASRIVVARGAAADIAFAPPKSDMLPQTDVDPKTVEMTQDLLRAGARREFGLTYQVQHCLTSNATLGFEVLLRWNSTRWGAVPPDEFLPLATQAGVMPDLGMWVLREACFEAASWDEPFDIAVNVAPVQIATDDFATRVMNVISASGLAPSRVELELSEGCLVAAAGQTQRAMKDLQGIGVRFTLQGFGTGRESLRALPDFPFDKVKIDRGIIARIDHDPQREAFVRGMVQLAQAVNARVCALGVERGEEVEALRRAGCAQAQGLLFGKPMDTRDLRKLTLFRTAMRA